MNGLTPTKVLKIGKKDQHKYTNKTPSAPSAEGEKRWNVLLFLSKPKIMDIFFIFYSIFFGLPLGAVELPHGVTPQKNLIRTHYAFCFQYALITMSELAGNGLPIGNVGSMWSSE